MHSDETHPSGLSASLDHATGELESFVEHKVSEILDAALEKAARIEQEAAERAQQTEKEAERKSRDMLEAAFTRSWRILDGIDLLENGVGDMIGALRAEMEDLAAELGSAWPVTDRHRTDAPPAFESRRPSPGGGEPAHESARSRDNGGVGNHAEVEKMIIEQVEILYRDGRSREEAERFVMRFKQGEDYLHVLDDVYPPGSEGA